MLIFSVLVGLSFIGIVYSLMKHTEAVYSQDEEHVSFYRRMGLLASAGAAIFFLLLFLNVAG